MEIEFNSLASGICMCISETYDVGPKYIRRAANRTVITSGKEIFFRVLLCSMFFFSVL